MRRLSLAALCVCAFSAGALAGPCDGRYQGMLTVQGQKGASVAPMQWTVRDTVLYGAFEGPSGIYMIEATVDAACNVVKGVASDYVDGAPMPMAGTVTEGLFRHNGPVRVTYRMRKEQ